MFIIIILLLLNTFIFFLIDLEHIQIKQVEKYPPRYSFIARGCIWGVYPVSLYIYVYIEYFTICPN